MKNANHRILQTNHNLAVTHQEHLDEERNHTKWMAVKVAIAQHHDSLSLTMSFEVDNEGVKGDEVVVGTREGGDKEALELMVNSGSVGGVRQIWRRQTKAAAMVVGRGLMMVTGGVEKGRERKFYNDHM